LRTKKTKENEWKTKKSRRELEKEAGRTMTLSG